MARQMDEAVRTAVETVLIGVDLIRTASVPTQSNDPGGVKGTGETDASSTPYNNIGGPSTGADEQSA